MKKELASALVIHAIDLFRAETDGFKLVGGAATDAGHNYRSVGTLGWNERGVICCFCVIGTVDNQ